MANPTGTSIAKKTNQQRGFVSGSGLIQNSTVKKKVTSNDSQQGHVGIHVVQVASPTYFDAHHQSAREQHNQHACQAQEADGMPGSQSSTQGMDDE